QSTDYDLSIQPGFVFLGVIASVTAQTNLQVAKQLETKAEEIQRIPKFAED
uniref:Uncharacterized protein n=1 Tax=Scleropages formosus TaxID=113540 RepID=A0A8C9T7E8_SCLFO